MGGGDINLKAELMSQLPTWVWALYAFVCLYLAPFTIARLAKRKHGTIGLWGAVRAILASNILLLVMTTFLIVSVITSYYGLKSSETAKLVLMVTVKLLTSKTLIVGWIFQGTVVFFLVQFILNRDKEGLRL